MKISLNWIFDHINGELAHIDVAQLVSQFIKTTAEIEGWKKVSLNVDDFTIARVVSILDDVVIAHSLEYNKDYNLGMRPGALVGSSYLIARIQTNPVWATAVDFGATKDMLLPALDGDETLCAGGWKCHIEVDDYIIDVDNKSINNRPDLWGHRGLAREIAAILDLSLKPLDQFTVSKPIVKHTQSKNSDNDMPFSIAIDSESCKQFSAFSISSVVARPSIIDMVVRLSRVDSRAIDLFVDTTNYVMLDLGQPMHVFDADTLSSKNIGIKHAQNKEKLLLLDGQTIELTAQDLIIADGGRAISLAGIMGGVATSVTSKTTSLLVESATFEPTGIRRTANRHKKITESSKRFEKSLDSHQAIDALQRFLFILDKAHVAYTGAHAIVSIGNENVSPTVIRVGHQFIEARLGVQILTEKIISILEKLCFTVVSSRQDSAIIYTITVPSFRATKEIKIAEDIVEEVGRYIGYDSLPRVMPSLPLRPSDLHKTYCTRTIKNLLSYGLLMRELYGYSFFDETVLSLLAWEPKEFVAIKNPISENYTRLVTTLQPHLLKAVADNSIHHEQLRFYEWGRVWRMENDNIIEQKALSGIFFDRSLVNSQHIGMDFYTGKALIKRLFDKLYLDVSWQTCDSVEFSWCMPYQTAVLMHGDVRIGVAGMVEQSVVKALSPTQGAAFIFEVNADYLLNYKKPAVRFDSLSKYPSVRRDVSILIRASVDADDLTAVIQQVDQRIQTVILIDFFTKTEWIDQKAMTFHVEMSDKEHALSADDIEALWARVIIQLQQHGAVIR